MKFIHGLSLRNDGACHNLSLTGTLWTPNFLGLTDTGLNRTFRHIDDIPVEELRWAGPTGNAVAPRVANYVIPGAILDRGLILVDGHEQPVEISDGKRSRILDLREAELAMEAGRRKYAPKAASRFSSIWLAERTREGEASIRTMLGGGAHIFIVPVKIAHCLALTRVDAGWFDDYLNSPKEHFIENYWTGVPHKAGQLWEYLLDGSIELEDANDLEHIRVHGAKLFGADASGQG
ncbi:hypothetical protein BLA34_12660 [Ralstonia solanacearum]|nr:hypothetical protein BLA34_12660 [Ralstonia solanacearum]